MGNVYSSEFTTYCIALLHLKHMYPQILDKNYEASQLHMSFNYSELGQNSLAQIIRGCHDTFFAASTDVPLLRKISDDVYDRALLHDEELSAHSSQQGHHQAHYTRSKLFRENLSATSCSPLWETIFMLLLTVVDLCAMESQLSSI